MELLFLALLLIVLIIALGSGYPVAFSIPGSAILVVAIASFSGYLVTGDVDAYFTHGGGPYTWLSAGVTNLRGVYRSDSSDTLIAIPLFVFMGLMLQRSKVAEDLLLAMAQLFGVVRGGLGVSVIIVGGLLAATTGIVGATVIAMGTISLPTMLRNNYSKPLATGIIAATGTLGQIIPPSIVLIILVQQLTTAVNKANTVRRTLYTDATNELLMPSEYGVFSVTANEMFMGALVPGLALIVFYILYVIIYAQFRPKVAPTVSYDQQAAQKIIIKVLLALFPPLMLILVVLGSILTGVATVNQAGAIGAAGATVMAGYRLRGGQPRAFTPALIAIIATIALWIILNTYSVNLRKIETNDDVHGVVLAAIASMFLILSLIWSGWRTLKLDNTLRKVVEETTKTTALVFAILLGAVMLTAAFRSFGGEDLIKDFLNKLPGGFWAQFAIVMVIIFILGFFLDFIEITVVVIPIVAPILLANPSANIAVVWLGVMFALNIQTSFLTPPFGFALFYLRGVAPPSIRTLDIYKGVIPFILIQLFTLGVVGAFPKMVTYLPTRMNLLSDLSPPSTSPRLQYCIENYVFQRLETDETLLRKQIEQIKSANFKILPKELQTTLSQSFTSGENAFVLMAEIKERERAVAAAAISYRPILENVRAVEHEIGQIDEEISLLTVKIRRAEKNTAMAEAEHARKIVVQLTLQRSALLTKIPQDWDAQYIKFITLQKAENNARKTYRRTVDAAYKPVASVLTMIADIKALDGIRTDLQAFKGQINSGFVSDTTDKLKTISKAVRRVEGATEIRNAITKVRRMLRRKTLNMVEISAMLAKAAELVEKELAWRSRAKAGILTELSGYEAAIADTIGLRGQSRLPRHVAKNIAACSSSKRDIFLNF